MRRALKKIILIILLVVLAIGIIPINNVRATFTTDDYPYPITFVQVEANSGGTVAIDKEGYLWAWGDSRVFGNPISNTFSTKQVPTKVTENLKFSKIAAGTYISLIAIDENGDLWQERQSTVSSTDTVIERLVKMDTTVKFKDVYTGFQTAAAIDVSGNLWMWGDNSYGQIGDGTNTDYSTPVQIMSNVKKVATGRTSTLAIDNSGKLWYWGRWEASVNGVKDGSLTPTQILTNKTFIDISVNYTNFMAVDSSGNLWEWGGLLGGTDITSDTAQIVKTNIKNVRFSDYNDYVVLLDNAGTVWTRGENSYGQLGNGTTTDSNTFVQVKSDIKTISAGKEHVEVLDNDGCVWAWGSNVNYALGNPGSSLVQSEYTTPIQITTLKYTVTFKDGETIVSTQTINPGESATAPTNLTKQGYTLSWDKSYTNVTSDLTVNAIWTANTNTPYKVEHYKQDTSLNGYTLFETENKTGTTDSLAIAIAKTYVGFSENTTHPQRIPSGTVAGDGSLVLKLYYDRNSYTVTLNTNGGTVNSGNVTSYTYGVGATLPTNVTKTGYTFNGWYENSSLTGTAVTSISTTDTGNKTYYAKWTTNQYTVTFKNGNIIEKTETVNYASSATAPSLTKAGYTLSWDTDFSNVTSDLTVNAIWTANTNTQYKVEHYQRTTDLEVEGYTLFETENKTGTTDTTVTAAAKTYTGFTENTTYIGRVVTGTIEGDGSLVLKLYYDRNTYNITYNLNGGTATSNLTQTYLYGKELILSNKVEKTGYTFVGWYDNQGLTGNQVVSIKATETGDKAFYAKWVKEDEYNITSVKYEIQDSYITKVSPDTSVDTFLSNINTNGIPKVFDTQGNEITGSTLVGTGSVLKVEFKGTKHEYVIAVRGDIDGNGKITVTDLSMLNQQIVKKITLTGAKEKAADIDYSGKTTVTDLSMLNQALVGKITL